MNVGAPRPTEKDAPAWLRVLVLGAAFGIALYWFATFSGPYRWLAEWQLAAVGRFWVMPTVAVILISTLGLGTGAIHILAAVIPARRSVPSSSPARRWPTETAWLATLAAGLFLLAASGWFVVHGKRPGEPVAVDATALQIDPATLSRFARVEGMPMLNQQVTVRPQDQFAEDVCHYFPVAPAEKGQPVRLFVKVSDDDLVRARKELGAGHMVGMLHRSGLPGAVASQWRVKGNELGEPLWVLDWEARPANERAWALPVGGVGVVLLAAGLLLRRRTAAGKGFNSE